MSAENDNSNAKAFGGVLVLLALIAGVYAMIEPMTQRIDFLERQMQSQKDELEAHKSKDDHPHALSLHSEAAEKFRRVESEFRAIKELFNMNYGSHENRLQKIESLRTSEEDRPQWERITALERNVFGSALPVQSRSSVVVPSIPNIPTQPPDLE